MAPPVTKAPLAGRPPFATEDDDSIFEQAPATRRIRQPKPQDPNARTSAYNIYDQYSENNRDSGAAFGVGMGLMGDVSDDSDSDDERPNGPSAPGGKNRALYEAATRAQAADRAPVNLAAPSSFPPDVKKSRSPSPPGYTPRDERYVKPAPGPSLAIQIPPTGQTLMEPPRSANRSPMPAPIPQHAHASPARPVPAFMIPPSPAPSNNSFMSYPASPHPLPPSTPITPLFAAPPAAKTSSAKVTFPNDALPIMRGNSEDALLIRSDEKGGRAGQGDDFWRRFSMVAHQAESRSGAKPSVWLAKTQSGTRKLALWVWLVGITLLAAIGVGIGVGWYATHNNPSHTDPVAIGGSANQSMGELSSTARGAAPTAKHTSATVADASQPTNVARDDRFETYVRAAVAAASPSPSLPVAHRRHREKRFNQHNRQD